MHLAKILDLKELVSISNFELNAANNSFLLVVYAGNYLNNCLIFISVSERELERLKHALTLLSEAEKHLRASSERSTWFTATLLQLGSVASPDRTHSGSSRRQSSKATEEDRLIMLRESTAQKQRSDSTSKDNSVSLSDAPSFHFNPNLIQFIGAEALTVTRDDCKGGRSSLRCMNAKMLSDIWLQCIEKCHSKTLRQLLHSHGRLVSISEVKGNKQHYSFL